MPNLNPLAALEVKQKQSSWAIDAALLLLIFLGLSYIVVFTVLLLHLSIRVWSLSLFFVLYTAIISLWIIRKYPIIRKNSEGNIQWDIWRRWKTKWLSALIAFILILVSFVLSALVYDTSYDGQGYHQMAIVSMTQDWDPLYSPYYGLSLWVWHYPKALWMIGANFYSLTGLIDTGKAVNLISFFASFLALFAVLSKLFAHRLSTFALSESRPARLFYGIAALVITVCAACNPVTIVQLCTYYNDGIIGSLLLALISALLYHAITSEKRSLLMAAICIIVLINIKFTALAYAGLICTFYLLYLAFKNRILFKRAFIYLACAGFIGIAVLGYNPYVVNTLSKGNPFYPLAGMGKVDIITENSPANFIGISKLKAFLLSNTSMTYNSIKPENSHPTKLWPVKWRDFRSLDVDTRTAGFGPLTYWILIGSTALWAIMLLLNWRIGIIASLITLGLLATVFINPAPWWARYVPQLWLVPLALAALGIMTKSQIVRAASIMLLIIVLVSTALTVRVVLGVRIDQSNEVQAQLNQLKNKHIEVFTNYTASVLPHLQEKHIDYTEVKKQEELPCANPTKILYGINAAYCE